MSEQLPREPINVQLENEEVYRLLRALCDVHTIEVLTRMQILSQPGDAAEAQRMHAVLQPLIESGDASLRLLLRTAAQIASYAISALDAQDRPGTVAGFALLTLVTGTVRAASMDAEAAGVPFAPIPPPT